MIKLLIIFLGILPVNSQAKCFNISHYEYFLKTPILFKGIVDSVIEKESYPGKDVTLNVKILIVFKGKLSSENITLKYKWFNVKEPLKTYKKGQYIHFWN